MASFRKTPSGKCQATVRLPDGTRRTATLPTRREAGQWAHDTEAAARGAATYLDAGVTWRPEGLHIFVPADLVTMDMAAELEAVVRRVLSKG